MSKVSFLRKNLLRVKQFGLNIILLIVATLLVIMFSTVGVATSTLVIIFTPTTTTYFRDIALCLDIMGNVMCQYLFGVLLTTPESVHHFGQVGETVSSVLGKNERDNTLTDIGSLLANILNWLDKKHCYNSIDIRFDTSK